MRENTAVINRVIPLGRQGENEAQVIIFNVNGWSELYGEGAYYVLHKRNGDSAAYPCNITVEDGKVKWTVESADTAKVGIGTAQLTYVVDGVIAESETYTTLVTESLNEVPDPTPTWITDVIKAGEDAVEAAEKIQSMPTVTVEVAGETPTIVGEPYHLYVCGEVSTLDFTPSETGLCDVIFISGTTPTVLTLPNTLLFPIWFDPDHLESNATYEINVMDGKYGAVTALV